LEVHFITHLEEEAEANEEEARGCLHGSGLKEEEQEYLMAWEEEGSVEEKLIG
jgi:hypothetical protein